MTMTYDANSRTFKNILLRQSNISIADVLQKLTQLKNVPTSHPSYGIYQVSIQKCETLLSQAGYKDGDDIGEISGLSALLVF